MNKRGEIDILLFSKNIHILSNLQALCEIYIIHELFEGTL